MKKDGFVVEDFGNIVWFLGEVHCMTLAKKRLG